MLEVRQIIVIGKQKEFLTNAVIEGLKSLDFEVTCVRPRVNALSSADPEIKLCLLFIDSVEEVRELLVYLNDSAADREMRVCIVAEKPDLPQIFNIMPESQITKVFERPIVAREIGTQLLAIYDTISRDNLRKSILIIDDDPTFLRRTQQLLRDKYKVYMANSGVSAIMLLSKHKVDLILLDYEMPVTSGKEVYEMLKAEEELGDIPIMFLTGKKDVESVRSVLRLKPVRYLTKSMPVADFLSSIAEFFFNKEWENM
ncbi:MAG: response regulator [Lachnospiraceae bacterium]|nr:response regulator [Lachnospiraceae bacterium]